MRKIAGWLLILLLLCLLSVSMAQEEPKQRALLVASDLFVTQHNTWPASSNNLKAIEAAFSRSRRSFESIDICDGTLTSLEGLKEAIQVAFGQAGPSDVSYFYISTHGVYDPAQSNLNACLFLSDGEAETHISARDLEACFDGIQGTKVLLIDACQSGAFIGKGISGGSAQAAFVGPDFKVLTSAGGSEDSWWWAASGLEPGRAAGSSYFSAVLCQGISAQSGFEADESQDGEITLDELYAYLMENHAASTPQVYPQGDDFVFFTYDRSAYEEEGATGLVTGIQFEETLLDARNPMVTFSFTVTKPATLAYQLVYYRDNRWQFDSAQLIYDDQEIGGDFGDQRGLVSPGRKVRNLTLGALAEEAYGYVMVQLITLKEGEPTIHASRVLCVPPITGDLALEVKTAPSFVPANRREMPVMVSHRYPCQMNVGVYNEAGELVARLASSQSTRPERLIPSASSFYWNGRTSSGEPAPAGNYYIKVKATLGHETFTAQSPLFELIEANG